MSICAHHQADVATLVGVNVRQVRGAISRLRAVGWPIGFGDHGGYRLAWDRSALEALLRNYRFQALAGAPLTQPTEANPAAVGSMIRRVISAHGATASRPAPFVSLRLAFLSV